MDISIDQFTSLDQLLQYLEASDPEGYNMEVMDEMKSILSSIEATATARDGFCHWCSGVKLDWTWETTDDMHYTGGGFWFCPKCLCIYRPRPNRVDCWAASRQTASIPLLSREGVLCRQAWSVIL